LEAAFLPSNVETSIFMLAKLECYDIYVNTPISNKRHFPSMNKGAA
jgi:hypothetical protein